MKEDRKSTINQESKKTRTHVHTGTWYLVLRVIPATVYTRKITAQHGIAPQGTTPHGASLVSYC